ncbi:MAG: hypothetical protein HZC40_18475 [Chloroflexi bacterium]|nr:hypothetical protein [Chloroflexota bacterium]
MKKIIFAVLVIVVLGVIIGGALVRTNDRVGYIGGTNGEGRGGGWGQAQTPITDWITTQGVVTSVDAITLTVKLNTGEILTVENRPWSFALEQKFSASVGDQIKIVGFNSGGYWETAQIHNLTTGKTVVLRD